MLNMYIYLIVLLVFTSFWDAYTIEETFGCDKHHDCYVGDNSEDPIRVCDLINLKNTSVICYRLKFDIITAWPCMHANIGSITFVAIGGFGLIVLLVHARYSSKPLHVHEFF